MAGTTSTSTSWTFAFSKPGSGCHQPGRPSLKTLHDLFLNEEHLEENLDRLKNKVAREAYELMDADLKATTDSQKYSFTERIQGVRNKLDAFAHPAIQRVTGPDAEFRLERLMEKPSCLVFAAPMRMGLAGETLAAMAVRLIQYQLHQRYGHTGGRLFLILDEFSKLALDHGRQSASSAFPVPPGRCRLSSSRTWSSSIPEPAPAFGATARTATSCEAPAPKRPSGFLTASGNAVSGSGASSASASHASNRQSESGGLSAHEEYVPVLRPREITLTGGLERGAWLQLSRYSHKPILVDLTRPL